MFIGETTIVIESATRTACRAVLEAAEEVAAEESVGRVNFSENDVDIERGDKITSPTNSDALVLFQDPPREVTTTTTNSILVPRVVFDTKKLTDEDQDNNNNNNNSNINNKSSSSFPSTVTRDDNYPKKKASSTTITGVLSFPNNNTAEIYPTVMGTFTTETTLTDHVSLTTNGSAITVHGIKSNDETLVRGIPPSSPIVTDDVGGGVATTTTTTMVSPSSCYPPSTMRRESSWFGSCGGCASVSSSSRRESWSGCSLGKESVSGSGSATSGVCCLPEEEETVALYHGMDDAEEEERLRNDDDDGKDTTEHDKCESYSSDERLSNDNNGSQQKMMTCHDNNNSTTLQTQLRRNDGTTNGGSWYDTMRLSERSLCHSQTTITTKPPPQDDHYWYVDDDIDDDNDNSVTSQSTCDLYSPDVLRCKYKAMKLDAVRTRNLFQNLVEQTKSHHDLLERYERLKAQNVEYMVEISNLMNRFSGYTRCDDDDDDDDSLASDDYDDEEYDEDEQSDEGDYSGSAAPHRTNGMKQSRDTKTTDEQLGCYYDLMEKYNTIKEQNGVYLAELSNVMCEFGKERKALRNEIRNLKGRVKELEGAKERNAELERLLELHGISENNGSGGSCERPPSLVSLEQDDSRNEMVDDVMSVGTDVTVAPIRKKNYRKQYETKDVQKREEEHPIPQISPQQRNNTSHSTPPSPIIQQQQQPKTNSTTSISNFNWFSSNRSITSNPFLSSITFSSIESQYSHTSSSTSFTTATSG